MQTVTQAFREQEYSGEALFNCILRINDNLVPVQQIASIKIKSPIIDTSTETFYVGSFISQTITIKFKNLEGLDIQSKYNVHLEIGQSVDGTYTYLPMGEYLIDDLSENYQTTCEITCMDYAVKFKPNIDYSPCFTDGKANVNTIIEYICNYFNVELGSDLTLLPNPNVEVGTYDSTISGKQWLSYLAEIKGCNLKMSRDGKLLFIPFVKDNADIEIDALKSAEWEVGEKYQLTRIVYFDAIRNFTKGNESGNTLFIRQDNPFVTDESVINNIANQMLLKNKEIPQSKEIEINDGNSSNSASIQLFGDTYQEGTPTPSNPQNINVVTGLNTITISGKNMFDDSCITNTQNVTNNDDGSITINGRGVGGINFALNEPITLKANETYTMSLTNYYNSGAINIVFRSDANTNIIAANLRATTYTPTQDIVLNYIRIFTDGNTVFDNFTTSIQLEKSSSATFYERYKSQNYQVDLGQLELCKIGDYQDYIYKEDDKWYLHKEIEKIDSYNGTSITTDYISTTGELTTGATIYYVLNTATNTEITDTNLLSQLEAIYNFNLYNGINIISTTAESNLKTYLKLNYNIDRHFTIWSLKNKNYGDISLDAWDIIQFNLGDEHYWTYNDNELTYEMNISTIISTQIPNKQKEITTNVVGGDIETKIRMLKTNLDYVNNKIELLLQETSGLTERTNQLVLDILSTQNIFQITGGSNLINNSQFLYTNNDNEFWTLVDNGSNPYNNMGDGYDANLIGKTTSVSKIQLRDTILTSSNTNIVNLKQNQQYTLNYSYKQDNLTTTKVELIEAISGNKIFEKTYNEQVNNITNETIQFVAEETSYIFKVTTSTISGDTNTGYFYLYDLMLNSGDKKNWEPAKSEVYSTVVKMSQMGLSVIATGSNIITLLTSQGFQVRKYVNDQIGVIITEFTDTGIITGDIESKSISTGNYISTEMTIGGREHHVEYFKE